ncbi:MAG: winged helix-turn-helix domain-containing protein [Eubacteriales bacterium]|nr:winged helix-turn-helix domain-containing protein [Eubacteriales bacterium]
MKKVEIIARVQDNGKPVTEQTLLSWSDEELRMNHSIATRVLYYPGLEIQLHQKRVLKNGKDVHLTKYEYGILSLMAQHPGILFSKEQLFEAVWHENSESCLSAISNTIGRIRQKRSNAAALCKFASEG